MKIFEHYEVITAKTRLDAMLPDVNGFILISKIKKLGKYQNYI